MNGAGLTSGSIAGSGANGGVRIMGAEATVHSKLAKVTEGDLVTRSWVDGSTERMWKPLRICLRRWGPG